MASKHILLNWCSVSCTYVFRVDYLVLDNRLVCSSLEKTKRCPSNKDFSSIPEGNQGQQQNAVFRGSFFDSLLANNSKFCRMENWLALALHVRANSNFENKLKSSLFNSLQRQNSKETSSFCTCLLQCHFSTKKYSSPLKMSQRVNFSILADILKYRMTFARLSQYLIIKLKLKSMGLKSQKHRHISIRKLEANLLWEHSSFSKDTTTHAVDFHDSGQVCWLVLHVSLLQPKVSLEDIISWGAVQGMHSWELR